MTAFTSLWAAIFAVVVGTVLLIAAVFSSGSTEAAVDLSSKKDSLLPFFLAAFNPKGKKSDESEESGSLSSHFLQV